MLVRWPADLGNPLAMFSLPSETEAAAPEVAARTTELALRVLESPKLKADAERLEKARAELSKEAARWRGEAAGLEKVNDDVAQDVPAVKEEIADLKKLFWPASLSKNPDVVAAALAAVDAAPLADVRGTFWPDATRGHY